MAASAATDDHQEAEAALTDVKAALAELVRADASYAADPKVYRTAAQRAINVLTGAHDPSYAAGVGTAGDAAGAIGNIDRLLDRTATPVWVPTVQSAEANIRAAVAHLQDATKADELMEWATAATRAIDYLEVARGRPNESGVFSGLDGVLANTDLGIPTGAVRQDACQQPSSAPAFGTHGGYISWVALPAREGTHALVEASGATTLSVQSGMIVLHTAAAPLVDASCRTHARAADQPAAQSSSPAQAPPSAPVNAKAPALYTKAQAEQGEQIFQTKCVACHGVNLQGTAAPSVAGNDFLVTADHNGWTLEIMRYIVFDQMPRNAPATLSPQDSAAVMAYLLASNCYPAGEHPFPPQDDPAFARIKLRPVPGEHPDKNAKGVCKLN